MAQVLLFFVEDKVLLVMYDSNIKEVINCLKFKSPKPWQATKCGLYSSYGKNLKRDWKFRAKEY